jgi:N utilization substance protein B
MTRKETRDLAFKLIYQTEAQKETPEYIFDIFYLEHTLSKRDKKYVEDIVFGVFENKAVIEGKITPLLAGWRLERVSAVSLSAVKLSCYEILFRDDIPDSVSINEAVTLAKTYEGGEAAGFVNGILASVLKGKEEGQA